VKTATNPSEAKLEEAINILRDAAVTGNGVRYSNLMLKLGFTCHSQQRAEVEEMIHRFSYAPPRERHVGEFIRFEGDVCHFDKIAFDSDEVDRLANQLVCVEDELIENAADEVIGRCSRLAKDAASIQRDAVREMTAAQARIDAATQQMNDLRQRIRDAANAHSIVWMSLTAAQDAKAGAANRKGK
jgi:hypothetical protein